MSTISKENYLKTIYQLNDLDNDIITTSQVAQKLNVTNAATSDMARKLADSGLINYRKYKGINLTSRGERVALNVLRRHRLWELFLIKVLDLSWSEVHDEAELLEHQTSERLIDRIDEFLGFPEVDPHGSPIPNKNGDLPNLPQPTCIAEAEEGCRYTIAMVSDRDSQLIEYLTNLGIQLDKEIAIEKRLPFDNSLIIKMDDREITLSEKVSRNIFVTEFS
jgi:DtxR family Mn-dependent transcriptional regulator